MDQYFEYSKRSLNVFKWLNAGRVTFWGMSWFMAYSTVSNNKTDFNKKYILADSLLRNK